MAARAIIKQQVAECPPDCIMWGLAGALVGMTTYYKRFPSEATLSKVRELSHSLLSRSGLGVSSPPTLIRNNVIGLAHGLCGVALALQKAYEISGCNKLNVADLTDFLYQS